MKLFKDKHLHGWDDEKIYFTPKEGKCELCVSDEPILFKKLCVICESYYRCRLHKPVHYAFIDSQNVNLSIRDQGWKLDFHRFRKYLKDKYEISSAFLFVGYVATNERLYTTLKKSGYNLIFKPTLLLPNGRVKGNVDAELVLHTMIEYENYDNAMIVTGDGDFSCLVDHLKRNGKLSKLLIPDRNQYSSLLRRFMPDIAFMNELKKKLEQRGIAPIKNEGH